MGTDYWRCSVIKWLLILLASTSLAIAALPPPMIYNAYSTGTTANVDARVAGIANARIALANSFSNITQYGTSGITNTFRIGPDPFWRWDITDTNFGLFNYTAGVHVIEASEAQVTTRLPLRINGGIKSSDGTAGATASTGGATFKDGLYTGGTITGGGGSSSNFNSMSAGSIIVSNNPVNASTTFLAVDALSYSRHTTTNALTGNLHIAVTNSLNANFSFTLMASGGSRTITLSNVNSATLWKVQTSATTSTNMPNPVTFVIPDGGGLLVSDEHYFFQGTNWGHIITNAFQQ